MYKIINKTNEVRKFRDRFLGKDIFIQPNESALSKKKVPENSSFEITLYKKKIAIKLKEVNNNNNGSNSNR